MGFGSNAASRTSKFSISAFVGGALENGGNILNIPVEKLKPFNNGRQPFRMYTSDEKQALMDSISTNGLLQPILVREKPDEEGSFEILAGHNRVEACKALGMPSVKSIILSGLNDAQAYLVVTDTNLYQRSEQLPSERAAAYQMQKEALKALGVKNAVEAVSEQYGESRKTVSRYLSLNDLNNELLGMVDEGTINVNAGAILSKVSSESQEKLADYLISNPKKNLTEAAANKLKSALEGNDAKADEIIKEKFEKKPCKPVISVKLRAEELDEILEIPTEKLGDFLFFCLQHNKLQQEFNDLLQSSDRSSDLKEEDIVDE